MGVPYCPNGHGAIQSSSVEQIVDEVLALPERTRMQILAPIVRRRKGQHKAVFDRVQKDGYVRVRVDGEIYDVTEVPELSKSKMHNIEVVVDRLVNKDGIRSRLFDSVEAALRLADGYLIVDTMDDNELLYSEHYSCPVCGFTVPELEPSSLFIQLRHSALVRPVMVWVINWKLIWIWLSLMLVRPYVKVLWRLGILFRPTTIQPCLSRLWSSSAWIWIRHLKILKKKNKI